jgi:dTDP-4-amino-4,6-dideoxygalactose transaminase
LIGQLERIERLWEKRDEICCRYEDAFENIEGIKLMKTLRGCKHGRHLFTINVPPDKRDRALGSLQEKGVGVAVNYRAIHLLKHYREKFGFKEGDFPVAEQIGAGTISLPLYPKLKNVELDYVIEATKEIIGKAGGI